MPSILSVLLPLALVASSSSQELRGAKQSYGVAGPVDASELGLGFGSNCDAYATNRDLDQAGLTQNIKSWCTNHYGTRPDTVEVNSDGYEYKACLSAGEPKFGSLRPRNSQEVVASDTFTNDSNQGVKHTFQLSGTQAESITLETTNTVSLSTSVSFKVSVPAVLEENFSISTSFTSSRTDTHTDETSSTYTSTTEVDVPPRCSITNKLEAKVQKYSSDFKVPLCITGFVACKFPKRVKNPDKPNEGAHYFWYSDISHMGMSRDACWEQQGDLSSSVSIDSTTSMSQKGACKSAQEKVQAIATE